jgi:hypothetical protein
MHKMGSNPQARTEQIKTPSPTFTLSSAGNQPWMEKSVGNPAVLMGGASGYTYTPTNSSV